MNEYRIDITPEAQANINEIIQYIRVALKAPKSAASLLKKLKEGIASLAAFPARVAPMEEEFGQRLGIRKLPVKKYLIYFRIDEDTHRVLILAVVYGGRDQWQQLLEMDLE